MNNSFDPIFGKSDDHFYYGLKPSEELEAFLFEAHPPKGEALDLGCGEGRDTFVLARYGFHVHAIDYSSQGIQKLKKYAFSQGLQNIDCSIEDIRIVQLKPNFYDAIVATTLLDHLEREAGQKVTASILSGLKPGGFVYIEVFTVHDPGASNPTDREERDTVSETAYFIKHYFDEGELAAWFSELDIVLYEEKMEYDTSHGNPHYHGIARLIGIKRPTSF